MWILSQMCYMIGSSSKSMMGLNELAMQLGISWGSMSWQLLFTTCARVHASRNSSQASAPWCVSAAGLHPCQCMHDVMGLGGTI